MLRSTNDFAQKVINKTINNENKNGYKAQLDIRNGYNLEIKKDGKAVAKFKNSYQRIENWFKIDSLTYSSQSGLAYDDFGKTENNRDFEFIDEKEYLEAAQEFINTL